MAESPVLPSVRPRADGTLEGKGGAISVNAERKTSRDPNCRSDALSDDQTGSDVSGARDDVIGDPDGEVCTAVQARSRRDIDCLLSPPVKGTDPTSLVPPEPTLPPTSPDLPTSPDIPPSPDIPTSPGPVALVAAYGAVSPAVSRDPASPMTSPDPPSPVTCRDVISPMPSPAPASFLTRHLDDIFTDGSAFARRFLRWTRQVWPTKLFPATANEEYLPLTGGAAPMVVEPHHDYGSFPSPAAPVSARPGERGAMDESDSYLQSRPLLQDDGWQGTENGDIQHGVAEPTSNGGYYQTAPASTTSSTKSDAVRVDIGLPPPPRFPKEKLKTLLAFLWMVFNFLLTLTSLAITHERVPETPPLPDVVLDNVPTGAWALKVSETIIIVMVNSAFLVVLLHKHRFIVCRRIFLVMGLLYMMRSVLYFVTALPKPDPDYKCEPKAGYLSFTLVVMRVLKLLGGFGLSINGQHVYCGDYLYSGHTVTLTMAYMVLREYTPRHWWILHWLSLLAALTGVVMVLVARGHYTIDVLIAYYVSTRVFWLYHTMANNVALKESGPNNYLSRLWWFCMFRYFEKNVAGPVPRHYEWPLPWPRCLQNKRAERTS